MLANWPVATCIHDIDQQIKKPEYYQHQHNLVAWPVNYETSLHGSLLNEEIGLQSSHCNILQILSLLNISHLDIELCLRATLVSREELECLYIILPLCQCCNGQQIQHQISADDPTRKLHHPTPMSVSHSTTKTTYHVNRGILIVNYHFTVQGLINGNKWSFMFPSIIWHHKVTLWSSMHGKETHKTR